MSYITRQGTEAVQRAARRWLLEQGLIVQGETRKEHLSRLDTFRRKLADMPRPDAKQWARDLMADKRAGVPVPSSHIELAMGALGMDVPKIKG